MTGPILQGKKDKNVSSWGRNGDKFDASAWSLLTRRLWENFVAKESSSSIGARAKLKSEVPISFSSKVPSFSSFGLCDDL
jgi:hypothetical protein